MSQGSELAEATPEREEHADSQYRIKDPVGPDETGDRFDEVVECVHGVSVPWSD